MNLKQDNILLRARDLSIPPAINQRFFKRIDGDIKSDWKISHKSNLKRYDTFTAGTRSKDECKRSSRHQSDALKNHTIRIYKRVER